VLRHLLLCLAALLVCAPAGAVTLVDSPQQPAGPFRHNAFHDADSLGGAGGSILAWIDLDTGFGAGNFWDLGTGDFQGHFDVFSDSALSSQIGTAVATGNVSPTALADLVEQNLVVGTLSWDIDLGAGVGSDLYQHLETSFGAEADDVWEGITQSFADVHYATSSDGRTANTFDGVDLTLWGADGSFSGSSLLGGPGGMGGFGSSASLGLDLAVTTPEPATAALLGVGLVALAARGRRRQGEG
jgi:hypothetical protein